MRRSRAMLQREQRSCSGAAPSELLEVRLDDSRVELELEANAAVVAKGDRDELTSAADSSTRRSRWERGGGQLKVQTARLNQPPGQEEGHSQKRRMAPKADSSKVKKTVEMKKKAAPIATATAGSAAVIIEFWYACALQTAQL